MYSQNLNEPLFQSFKFVWLFYVNTIFIRIQFFEELNVLLNLLFVWRYTFNGLFDIGKYFINKLLFYLFGSLIVYNGLETVFQLETHIMLARRTELIESWELFASSASDEKEFEDSLFFWLLRAEGVSKQFHNLKQMALILFHENL